MRRPSLALLVLAAALGGCQTTPDVPSDLPPDVTDPARVRVFTGDGFRLYADRGCINTGQALDVLTELAAAKDWLVDFLGPWAQPGEFHVPHAPRAACTAPVLSQALAEPVAVVVLPSGNRCHADGDGITVVEDHLERFDATHELVHYISGSSWRPIDEGLATYLTERIWGPAEGVSVKIRARVFLDLNLQTFLDADEMASGMSRRDYDTAGAFVGWLIEAYGRERFFRLYNGPRRDYTTVYGVSEHELFERFWLYIQNLDVRQESTYYSYKARLTGR